ncbi:MAG: DNA alkylation repair protein [Atribacterota bacterium]|nr:DNA alkylation repair protein [Atribacterota bacterium]
MNLTIQKIRKLLKENIDDKTQKSSHRFFKEEVKVYGVKTTMVRKIANKFWEEIKTLRKRDIFDLCELLFSSDYSEEAFIASFWLPKITDEFEPDDWIVFESWIEKYVNNWAKCDVFCNHTMGDFLMKYPEFIKELKEWTFSNNRWMKRAAAVSLIVPAKKGNFLSDVFEICDRLLLDQDDMVQKGYGWLLKVTSHLHQKEVFDYVMKNKENMPRTALRYAIEKMPQSLRQEAMKR